MAILNNYPIVNTTQWMDSNFQIGSVISFENYKFSKYINYIYIRSEVSLSGCNLAARFKKNFKLKN